MSRHSICALVTVVQTCALPIYPSLSASYRIEKSADGVPTLFITMAFNPTPYVPAEEDEASWLQRAISDKAAYRQIYYQLLQEDMRLRAEGRRGGKGGVMRCRTRWWENN